MKSQCRMRNVECGMKSQGDGSARSLSIQHSPFPIRRGVTLIELLITMTIMAIIAAAILGTAAAAIEGSREKKTQSQIAKIHTLLMDRYSSYETRRVDIKQSWLTLIDSASANQVERGQFLADLRLLAQRELMKYEMPDRWSDVIRGPLGSAMQDPVFLNRQPALAQAYYRRSLNATAEYEGAECLYMTIMLATGDGEARTLFSKQDIGDVDGDGAPEFIDGWGNPIEYLRWAPGFYSRSALMTGDGNKDHDPFDVYRRDDPTALPAYTGYPALLAPYAKGLKDPNPAFRLVPLVFSKGSDGEPDVFSSRGKEVTSVATNEPALNPYFVDTTLNGNASSLGIPVAYGFGMPDVRDGTDATKDNITNHLLEY
jgi:prepilin-type N-terminal cleavage/methylation domain-containing protein